MKSVPRSLMFLCLLAAPTAFFFAILLQHEVLVNELASAFLLSDKVVRASSVGSRLLLAFTLFSLAIICWNGVLRNKLRKLEKTQNKRMDDTAV